MDACWRCRWKLYRAGWFAERIEETLKKEKSFFGIACVVFMSGVLCNGCTKTSDQKIEKAKESIADSQKQFQNTHLTYLTEWQIFLRESDQIIAANQKRIDAFKQKIEEAGPKAIVMYRKKVETLEQKNLSQRKILKEYKDLGQTHWEEFKLNFNRDMDALGKNIEIELRDTKAQ